MNSKRVANCSSPKTTYRSLENASQYSKIRVLESRMKPPAQDLGEADVVIAVGRGIKRPEDLRMIQDLAQSLSAVVAFSRPLIEAGWADSRFQIGLSGRSIQPKLLVTVGISGAVQFSAGIQGADYIVAINSDPDAPIFNVADLGFVGDCYEIIPQSVLYLNHSERRNDDEDLCKIESRASSSHSWFYRYFKSSYMPQHSR
jgi:electron transfer flavoprotein alpha subunit